MSTRCLIGIELEGYMYKYVYCHYDGYPENIGPILINHYNDRETINKLLDGGDFSSLEPNIEDIEFYNDERSPAVIDDLDAVKDSNQEFMYMFNLKDEWVCKAVPGSASYSNPDYPYYDFYTLQSVDLY